MYLKISGGRSRYTVTHLKLHLIERESSIDITEGDTNFVLSEGVSIEQRSSECLYHYCGPYCGCACGIEYVGGIPFPSYIGETYVADCTDIKHKLL